MFRLKIAGRIFLLEAAFLLAGCASQPPIFKAQKLEEYDNAEEARFSLYDELEDRVRKVRLALAAQYGKISNEYKDSLNF